MTTALATTRAELHRLAAHVLARRRAQVSGRIGLRVSPTGIATPAFGAGPEALRLVANGPALLREVEDTTTHRPIEGATLRQLAEFAGADLDRPFDAGQATPPPGDPDRPLHLDPAALTALVQWFFLSSVVLDRLICSLPPEVATSTVQLWPEHFDAGTAITLGAGRAGVNVGFSAGDDFEPAPYLYVGPWGGQRPGQDGFWNAPFGALVRREEVLASPDPAARCEAFVAQGIGRLSGAAAT